MATYEETNLGGLDTLAVRGDPRGLTVVVLHGYGADAFDLLPLAREIAAPPGTNWLFPHAPLQVEIGPHMTGRAWFPIDLMAMQLAMLSGKAPELNRVSPPMLADSVAMVRAMLRGFGSELARTVLMGFSQGAMVATALTLRAEGNPAGLCLFSGTLLDEAAWRSQAGKRAGLPFVQSHGRQDPLLSFAAAQRLHAILTDAGWHGDWIGFDGGHEIPYAAIAKASELLKASANQLPQ